MVVPRRSKAFLAHHAQTLDGICGGAVTRELLLKGTTHISEQPVGQDEFLHAARQRLGSHVLDKIIFQLPTDMAHKQRIIRNLTVHVLKSEQHCPQRLRRKIEKNDLCGLTHGVLLWSYYSPNERQSKWETSYRSHDNLTAAV